LIEEMAGDDFIVVSFNIEVSNVEISPASLEGARR